MDETEWAAWQEMRARSTASFDRAALPCHDCTAAFHRDMVDGGMCDGVPLPEPPPDRGGRPAADPEYLRSLSLDEIRALRASLPYHGAPLELRLAANRARWREYRRGLRVTA